MPPVIERPRRPLAVSVPAASALDPVLSMLIVSLPSPPSITSVLKMPASVRPTLPTLTVSLPLPVLTVSLADSDASSRTVTVSAWSPRDSVRFSTSSWPTLIRRPLAPPRPLIDVTNCESVRSTRRSTDVATTVVAEVTGRNASTFMGVTVCPLSRTS